MDVQVKGQTDGIQKALSGLLCLIRVLGRTEHHKLVTPEPANH